MPLSTLPARRAPAGSTVLLLGVALAFVAAPPAFPHADLLLQIEELTKEIARNPKDPDLYIRRGELRRNHQEWDGAYADYESAAALAPKLPVLDLVRGRLFLDSGWPLSARACLDHFLLEHTNHVDALVLRARALTRLKLRLAAALDYDRAIANSPEPAPDLFIERAQLLAEAGSEYLDRAVQGLEDGIRRLGPLVVLQLMAVDLELSRKNYDAAIGGIDRIAQRSPRKETWLTRKGDILKQAGRTAEARETFRQALAALQTLPPTRRNVPAVMELEKRLRREIESTGPAGSDATQR